MESADLESADSSIDPAPGKAFRRRRRLVVLAVFVALLLLALIPPLVNVSRYQRRVAGNIATALGRPVHFDQINLNLLPFPGFTLDNFVVEEDPAFGSEPILRASQVRVDLRLRSLWEHRIEFSSISLTDPSVNLVHLADGRWNIESLLLQTSHSQAVRRAVRRAVRGAASSPSGSAPHFPYIEASGARLNLKLGQEKTPFSLTDADFSLWLSTPHQWRLRIKAHPVRTDIDSADTGPFRIEATLGTSSAGTPDAGTPNADTPDSSAPYGGTPNASAANINSSPLANLPIDLTGEWRDVQLGGLSRLLIARDLGLRGELTLSIHLLGTLGHNTISARIGLNNTRRADFIPPHSLSVQIGCRASVQNTFHTFTGIECDWPPSNSSDRRLLALTASFPDIRQLDTASANLTLPNLPASTLLDWLSVATPRPPSGLSGHGILTGAIAWNATPALSCATGQSAAQTSPIAPRTRRRSAPLQPEPQPRWSGHIEFSNEFLQLADASAKPIPLGNVQLCTAAPAVAARSRRLRHRVPNRTHQPTAATGFELLPIELALGGRQPAILAGHFDATGYTLHLTGSALPARLLALGDDIPQIGDGLRQLIEPPTTTHRRAPPEGTTPHPAIAPIRLDLTATRAWGGTQSWHQSTPPPTRRHRSRAVRPH